jgi:hypothetical protein
MGVLHRGRIHMRECAVVDVPLMRATRNEMVMMHVVQMMVMVVDQHSRPTAAAPAQSTAVAVAADGVCR